MNHTMSFSSRIALTLGLLIVTGYSPITAQDVIIRNATVYDGSNQPGQVLDVAITGQRITAIGKELKAADAKTRTIDATGLILSPGFIDLHNHADSSIVAEATRGNYNYSTQGVTTIVTGNCGGGATDTAKLYAQLAKNGAGTNVAHLIPHGSIRSIVMKNDDREPTAEELAELQSLIRREMQSGAWGMSTGLIYIPGKFAKTEELIALSKTVAAQGGIYASHIRSEGDRLIQAIDETIRIGREAEIPVHVSHLKSSGKANWGKIVEACDHIARARETGQKVTADQYPYVASSTRLSAMIVPDWARVLTTAELREKLADPQARTRLADEIRRQLPSRNGGNAIMVSRFAKKPEYVGKRLDEIAAAEGKSVEDIVIEIQMAGDCGAISFGMTEEDVRFGMKNLWVATASDGGAHKPGSGDKPHPRVYGTFPRKIRYALDDKVIPLHQAIYAATLLPAEILGMTDRGRIAPGLVADIVVFDPATFRDKSTFTDSTQYADGVKYLMVNGTLVIDDAKPTDRLPGRGLVNPRSRPATALIEADFIWTGDKSKPSATAVAIRDGEIIRTGNIEEMQSLTGAATQRVKYPKGAMIVPGLIDAHAHLSSLGANLDELDLREFRSEKDAAEAVRKWAEARPGKGWILGRNWDQSLWPGQVFPTRESLDRVLPDRPVWLVRVDGHAGWANSEALKRAGVNKSTTIPDDGQMILTPNGEPSGLLVDGAMGLVWKAVPPVDDETLRQRMLYAQAECLRSGLTGVHDAGLDPQDRRVLESLDRAGLLKLRVYGMASAPKDPSAFFRQTRPGANFAGSGRYELRAMKFFIDGAMGSRGALMFEDYSDDPHNHGLQLIDLETFDRSLATALQTGWQICTHAIGDKGNALVLDAYEKAFREVPKAQWAVSDPRWRIEHAQVVRRDDVSRFAKFGIIASMQPSHASSDQRWADMRLGETRAKGAYAWSWFVQDGVKLAFGSDFPVEVVSPLWGIFGGVTRQQADGTPEKGWRPEHRLTMQQVLEGFTAGSAEAQFAENRLGRIAAGYRADFVVIDRDLRSVPSSEILKSRILATWVDGEICAGQESLAD
jgi:predicted amidohydrolase YtcJ